MSDRILAMSDEDFMAKLPTGELVSGDGAADQGNKEATVDPGAQAPDPPATETPTESQTRSAQGNDTLPGAGDGDSAPSTEEPSTGVVQPDANPGQVQPKTEQTKPGETDPAKQAQEPPKDGADGSKAAPKPGEQQETKPEAAPDYEAFFKKVMTPFKANGREISLKTPEEAIGLMQMGANYTRKMQEIAPHRKVLLMLENNQLLDEGKLSYAIDLVVNKNPDAIKKLIKDSGIDPLDIDVSTEPAYQDGNRHQVTDEEVSFRSVLDDVKSMPKGAETLQLIKNQWDDASKDMLWKHPEALSTIHQQRENGLYDRIAAEVERQRTLGRIGSSVPFLNAYTAVGDEMLKAGAFADLAEKTLPVAPPAPIATRAQAPKPVVTNGDRAAAASPTRSTPNPAKVAVNPLAMSDDDFMKQMEGRV